MQREAVATETQLGSGSRAPLQNRSRTKGEESVGSASERPVAPLVTVVSRSASTGKSIFVSEKGRRSLLAEAVDPARAGLAQTESFRDRVEESEVPNPYRCTSNYIQTSQLDEDNSLNHSEALSEDNVAETLDIMD